MEELITARPPYRRGTGAQRLVNDGYLFLARQIARFLAQSEIVHSVFLRRSLAAGEASFPRSDIDLSLIFDRACAEPGQVGPLLELNRRVRRLRRVFPILGQIETQTLGELPKWFRLEPTRESVNRRAAILLAGEPFPIPALPIPPENAAQRFAFWLESYAPRAINTGNRRNLWKFAVEMWSTSATARGQFPEPHVSRREAFQAWGAAAPRPDAPLESLLDALFGTAAELHRHLLPPLRPLQRPVEVEVVLPPSLATRRLVLVPSSNPAACLSHLHPTGSYFTPEAFEIYLRWTNPFLYDALPTRFLDLGFQRPPLTSYENAIERWTCGILARKPGFGARDMGIGPRTIAYATHAARCLAAGRFPAETTAAQLGPLAQSSHAIDYYFLHLYPQAYALCRH